MQTISILQFLTFAKAPAICLSAFLAVALLTALISSFHYRRKMKQIVLLNEKDKKKLEFLTFLTNEVRTPITMIATPLQKLTANSYDEETDKELESMQKNAVKIVTLIDKALNIDRLDDDGSELKFREINFIKYIYNLLSIYRYQARTGNIEMSFHSDKDTLMLWADRSKMDEALMTLIGSAIKATPPGGKIDIEATSDGKYASIVIKNTGKPLAEERIRNLFELFQRSEANSDSASNMEYYLCREIIRHHKGSISVANRTDCNGACFTVKLPVGNSHIPKNRLTNRASLLKEAWSRIDEEDKTDSDDGSNVAASGKRYSIIAIDEYPDICRYLRSMLSPNFNITTYTNPSEGLKAAISEVPDLVIAEVMMSEIGGITLVGRLKSNPNTSHVPVLLLTALPGEEIRVQGLLSGADAIISKPFNEEEFILSCNNLIKSRSRIESHIKEAQITKDILTPIEMPSNNDTLMQKVLETINAHISDPGLNVEILAEAIGISRGHLHRKIKEITGSSPGEYIRSIRLNQAAQLLKGEKKNISQIAYSVGYSNPSVFSTAFRQFFGISAKEYQQRFSKQSENDSKGTLVD